MQNTNFAIFYLAAGWTILPETPTPPQGNSISSQKSMQLCKNSSKKCQPLQSDLTPEGQNHIISYSKRRTHDQVVDNEKVPASPLVGRYAQKNVNHFVVG